MLSEGHDKTPVTQQLSFPEFSHGNEATQAGSALAPEVTTRLVGYQSLWVEGQGYFEKIANKVMTVWLVSNFLGASSLAWDQDALCSPIFAVSSLFFFAFFSTTVVEPNTRPCGIEIHLTLARF